MAFAAVWLGIGIQPCLGQVQGDGLVIDYARPGYATKVIYVWGAVATPGIWRVEREVGLLELLSVARPSGIGTEQPGLRDDTTVRLYRDAGGERNQVYEEDLEHIVKSAETYPILQEGDILVVETRTRRRINWQMVTSLVGTASSLVLLYLRLQNL